MRTSFRSLTGLSRRQMLALAGAVVALPTGAVAADPPFALVAPQSAASLFGLAATPMGVYALRSAQRSVTRAPQPMPVVHTEGTLPHEGIYDQSAEAKRDWQAALDASLGARLNGDRAFAAKAAEFIAAWLAVYRPSLNPIDETDFDRMLVAFDLLPEADRAGIADGYRAFCRAMATGYLDAMPKLRGGTATNNWQSHRVKLATLTAFACGDAGLVERARAAFAKQLADNIRSDGTTLDFAERDALHYVVYDLEPLAVAALAASTHGQDWYGDGGGALARALTWLAPFAAGAKTHEEFVRSTVEFDRKRAAAGVAGFAGPWAREGAEYLYALAGRLDPQFIPLAAELTPGFTGTRRPQAPWLHLTLPA